MTADTTLARVMARNGKDRDARQSEAYVWLKARFKTLSPRLRYKPGWCGLAEDMAVDGIKGGKGKPLTTRAVREIWSRVCNAVDAEEAARRNAAQTNARQGKTTQFLQSREPERGKDADRPPPVLTAPALRPPVPSYPPPVLPPPTPLLLPEIASRPHEDLSEEEREVYAKAQILRLRRRFAEASGHDPNEVK